LDYPAYDAAQLISETGASNFSLAEIDSRAIKASYKKGISERAMKASRQLDENKLTGSASKTRQNVSISEQSQPGQPQISPSNTNTMANPSISLNSGKKSMGHISLTQEPEYEVTTYCCCLKRRTMKPINYAITTQPDVLETSTNPNPNQLDNPLLR